MIIPNELVAALVGAGILVVLVVFGFVARYSPRLRAVLSPARGGLIRSSRPALSRTIPFLIYALLLLAWGAGTLVLCARNGWDAGQLALSLAILAAALLYLYTLLAGRMRQSLAIIPILQLAAGAWVMPILIFYIFVPKYAVPILVYFAVGVCMLVFGRKELKENRTKDSTLSTEGAPSVEK